MLFILFFMNLKLSDSTFYYICPIIQEPSEKTALNLTDEKFFIFNFSFLVFQTLKYFIKTDVSYLNILEFLKPLCDILFESYISLFRNYDKNITEEESIVKNTEKRIIKDFTDYMKNETRNPSRSFLFHNDEDKTFMKNEEFREFLGYFCQELSKYFLEIYENEKEMLNEVLKFNIKTYLYFAEKELISVKQKIVLIKHEFCINKNFIIVDLSDVKKTDMIYLNTNFCNHQVITKSSNTVSPLENFRKDITNFYNQIFLLLKVINATGSTIIFIQLIPDNIYFHNYRIKNIEASKLKLNFLMKIIYEYILFIHTYINFLSENLNLQLKIEEFKDIIDITVFSYKKDKNSIQIFYEKCIEMKKSRLEINTDNVSSTKYDSATAKYFVDKREIEDIIGFIRNEEKQNDDTCNKIKQSDTKQKNTIKNNDLKEIKSVKKKNKKRNKNNKELENKILDKCFDDIDIVENEKFDTKLEKNNSEKEQECIDEIDSSKKLDEKPRNEYESVNFINNRDEELKKNYDDQISLNDDLDSKFMKLDVSKETSSSKKTINENILNIDEKGNHEFLDTKNQQNCKQQEQNDKFQGCIQKIKEQHQQIKKQERQDLSVNNGSNSTIPMINLKNTESNDLQMQPELNTTKQDNYNAKNNFPNSYTSSIGSKPRIHQEFRHQPDTIEKQYGYQWQNQKSSSKDKSHFDIAPNNFQYTKTNFTKPRIHQEFRHQPDTIEKQYGYQWQNHEMSFGNSDKFSYTTQKKTLKEGTLLDKEKKHSVESSEEHKQQIPANSITKNENSKVVESQKIESKNLSEEDKEFENAVLYWCS